jgi:hypothetical protein
MFYPNIWFLYCDITFDLWKLFFNFQNVDFSFIFLLQKGVYDKGVHIPTKKSETQ